MVAATHSVGPGGSVFAPMYTAAVAPPPQLQHEIDLRLHLLTALPGAGHSRQTSCAPLPPLAPSAPLALWAARLPANGWMVVNLGARLAPKRLSAAAYAELAALVESTGHCPVFTWGPSEHQLMADTRMLAPAAARLAPPTDLTALAQVLQRARAVISCDTGPMHLAVACGTPTCGLFLSTEPERYGYTEGAACGHRPAHPGLACCPGAGAPVAAEAGCRAVGRDLANACQATRAYGPHGACVCVEAIVR